MKVDDWIKKTGYETVVLKLDETVDEAVDKMLDSSGARDLFVVDENEKLVGHISHKRLAHYVLAEHRSEQSRRDILHRVASVHASDLMDSHIVFARMHEELDNVLHRMLDNDIEDLPVIDEDGKLCGLVNLTAILRAVRKGQLQDETFSL